MRTAEEIYDGYMEHLGAITRETTITMMKLYHQEQSTPATQSVKEEPQPVQQGREYTIIDLERAYQAGAIDSACDEANWNLFIDKYKSDKP